MNSETWTRLSEWHNRWLDAAPGDRDRMRSEFVGLHPALEAEADRLVSAGPLVPGFLETPALALTLHDLADDDALLASGTLVGPYRLVELLARGGMGQVYRATDVRLGRDVALKLVAGGTQHEPGVVDRFLQEARVTAALDRPNIVRLFDVGLYEGRPYLVMELLRGETLRRRLERGALNAADACRVALDVAQGLVAAHAAGLIHHDLKPENLFLTQEGPAKILDFGVATLAPAGTGPATDLASTARLLVGTAGYLAPEEVLGEPADGRADLFALGAVLHEMLTGRRAFARDHAIDTLYAVLHDLAPSLAGEAGITDDLAAIVSRLLEKRPAARFQSAADLAWTLGRLSTVPLAAPAAAEPGPRRRWLRPAAAVGLAAALVLAALWWRPAPAAGEAALPLAQFTWRLPDGLRMLSNAVVAPDGRRLAFVAGTSTTAPRLFVRDLSAPDARVIAGTEGARQPFWSPEGTHIAFFARGKLLTVAADGGAPTALADASDPRGGAWSKAGVILFAPVYRDSSLMRVSADGGPVTPVTTVDPSSDVIAHRWPSFLPDGVHFVYQLVHISDARRGVYVASLNQPDVETFLFPSESGAVYVAPRGAGPGTLLTVRANGIEARAFDAATLRVVGDVQRLAVTAARATPHEPAMLDASATVLTLAATPVPWGSMLVATSPAGGPADVLSGPELGNWPRLSADGRRLLRSVVDPDSANPDIWVRDLQRGTLLRVTTSRDFDVSPVWAPDGDRIAYRSGSIDKSRVAIVRADGTGEPEARPCPARLCEPTDWSADGGLLLNAEGDIWLMPLEAARAPAPLLNALYVERDARFSPDGRWIAYVSEESGHPEVSIRSIAGSPRRVVVSNAGGDQPVWKHDGSAIFYVNHEQMLHQASVSVTPDGGIALGAQTPVDVPAFNQRHWGTAYEVSADGRRVFLPRPSGATPPDEMTIVLGWRALLR